MPPKILRSSSYKFGKICTPLRPGVLVLNSAFKPFIESTKINWEVF